MSMGTRARLRALATAGVLALAAGSAAALGTTGAATAATTSHTLNFDCAVPVLGPQTFSATISSNAPTTLPTGSTVRPKVTTILTVPAALADTLRSFFTADHVSGLINSTTVVNGVDHVVPLTVPSTSTGSTGDAIPLTATGLLDPIKAGKPGTVTTLAAGPQEAVLTLLSGSTPTSLDVPCTPTPGQSLTLGTITSVKDGSKTKVAASYAKSTHQVHASVTVSSAHGIVKPTGKVKIVLKRGSTVVASSTQTLSSAKASATFKNVRKAGSYTVTASYGGSSTLKSSSGSASFRVR